jgi:type I restriction enzyme S subunit
MNAELLLAHYEQIAETPDATARLRRFILDLAVRGKLVPHDPNDEPASELLKRIAKEKARLVKAGEIKNEKPLDPITGENQPFDLPQEWSWVRLDFLSLLITKGSSPKWQGVNYVNADEGILFITSENVGNHQLRKLDDLKYVESCFRDIEPRSMLRRGDILMNLVGASIGRTAVYDLDLEANINQAVALVRLVEISEGPLVRYLLQYFNSPTAIDFMLGSRVITAQPNMSLTDAREFPIPLPPLAEQHRIVAKVDELMGLCDRLETARVTREAVRDRLAAGSLARLNAPDPETFQADAHFALDALAALTTRPDQIKQLRQTILNLAVRGKLVPQDTNDEPASELMRGIAAEKAQLVKAGEIRKEKPTPELKAADIPFEIPLSWRWISLEQLAIKITDGEHLSPNKTTSGMPLLTAVHVTSKGVTFESPQFVSLEDGTKFRMRCDPRRGDILICSRGTIGRCAVVNVDEIFCLMGSVIQFRLPTQCSPSYFNYFLSTDRAQLQMRGMSGATAVKALYLKDIRLCPMPLPPLAEQHRIVAKVDALMALCDRLEASLTTAAGTRRRLLDALLAEALAPANAHEMEAAAE